MKEHSPFKFLDAYQKDDYQVFFGREKETERLYKALSGVKHLLVYGPSGAGKTSLIECGLRNQFSDADWFALSIRRGDNINESVFSCINEVLEQKIILDPASRLPEDKSIKFGQAIEQLFEERFQPVYLLFDQFEELLILGKESEQESFFSNLEKLISYKIPCRILLIMREEFIGHLSEFENICPTIFKHRFRLEKMRKHKVGEVIEQILEAPVYSSFYIMKDCKALSKAIHRNLPDEKHEIELTHVQVFLSELWYCAKKETKDLQKPLLHLDLVNQIGNLKVILNNFLKKQLHALDKKYGKNNALEVLESMISEKHTKLQMSDLLISKELHYKKITVELPYLLKDLEQYRIIRSKKAGGQIQYEISHDLLAQAVGQNLSEEMQLRKKAEEVYKVYEEGKSMFNQDDIDYLNRFKEYKDYPTTLKDKIRSSEVFLKKKQDQKLDEAEEIAEKERQLRNKAELNTKKAKHRTNIAYFITLIAVFTAAAAFNYYREAQEQFKNAEQKELEALEAKHKEEQERKKSDSLLVIKENILKDLQNQIILTEEKEIERQKEEKKRKASEVGRKNEKIVQKINLAKSYMNNEGYDLALKELKKLLKLAPNHVEAIELIQNCEDKLKR